ncbi:MAG: GIY-YIG nuclease family protein, partial [Pacificimonas sp.]
MKTYWVYILRLRTGHYYVGHTNDIDRRLSEHQMGHGDGYVANRLPFEFLHCEDFPDRQQAFDFERRLKSWSRAKKEA